MRNQLALVTVLLLGLPAARAEPRSLLPFDYHGVTIDGGHLRAQADQVREYYLAIPNDDLLKGFRQRAGRPALGRDLPGWYAADVFHIFGQIISGLSRFYAATGDPACREKVQALVDGWAECIADDGFFYYSDHPNATHYVYDKMVGGLVDAYLYCHVDSALPALRRITDWAIPHLKRDRRYASGDSDTEWYTLSENLYRAYLATGDARYRDFAAVWEYRDYWGIFARRGDPFGERPDGGRTLGYHAYSHVNTLGGLGAKYLATGDRASIEALVYAYDWLQANEVYATGGYGPDETIAPREGLLARLRSSYASFETQCGSWAAFKMSKYLITATGDARYGDWIERLVYNAIGADIPMGPNGEVFYYADYNLGGGRKTHTSEPWPCCAGTRPEAVADYYDLVYFRDARSLCVNLFVPSTVSFEVRGVPVSVRQTTRFPEEPVTTLSVSIPKPTEFALRVRIPGWCAGPVTASINGGPPKRVLPLRNWGTIRRRWRDGDTVRVSLPMRLHSSSFRPGSPYPAAVLAGPVVLAFRADDPAPLRSLDLGTLDTELVPVPGEPLTYHLAGDPSVLARPFYAFKQNEPYFLYLDPTMPLIVATGDMRFGGEWPVNSGSFRATPQIGAWVEATFTGTGFAWVGALFDDAGIGVVSVDGKVVAEVDQYDPGRGIPFRWEHRGLSPGRHTLRITTSDRANLASKGHYINIAEVEVLRGP